MCVYIYARVHVHGYAYVFARRGTRGRIIREETSTYLDSSGALVDSHRFALAMRKEKPCSGWKRGREERAIFSCLRYERRARVLREIFCIDNNEHTRR